MKFRLNTAALIMVAAAALSAGSINAAAADDTSYVAEINSTNFPDDTFRSYVSASFDTNQDGWLSEAECLNVKEIDVSGSSYSWGNIQTLKGIELFANLKKLNCAYNKIESLDVSNCTVLTYLDCSVNNLTRLDVSDCTPLTYLDCWDNALTSLDVSGCTDLTYLDCLCNNLTSLDVSNCIDLTVLCCGVNSLTSLDVSGCADLTNLECSNNNLTSLDVSNCTALTDLSCGFNNLTSLDISRNIALTELTCYDNDYSIITINGSFSLDDLPAGFDPSKTSYWQGAEYDELTRSLKNFTSNKVTYKYDCGNNKFYFFTLIVYENIDNSGILTFDEEIGVTGSNRKYSSGDSIDYGTEIWIGIDIDDYVNNKVLINGEKAVLEASGDGYWYIVCYTVNSDVDIQLVPEKWTAEKMSKYVTLNADENVTVWFYNSYTEQIAGIDRPIKNGGYIGKNDQICLRIPLTEYPDKPDVYINGKFVDCMLNNDGMWQIWAYDVPDDSSELRIIVKDTIGNITYPDDKIVVYYCDENGNTVVCNNGDVLSLGTTIWPGIDIDDYVNYKLLVNGKEFELTSTGDGYWYNGNYVVNSDVDIQLVPETWTAERMSKYVILNADENVAVWFYNSYTEQIAGIDRPIKNGGYIGKNDMICLRIPSSVYSEKPDVYINGTLVDCSLNDDGMWQIWAYDVPDDSNELRISLGDNNINISKEPADVTVIEGLDTTLSVIANGSGLSYQWQRKNGASWVNVNGANSSELVLNDVAYDMNGSTYRCVISNGSSSVNSASASVNVKPAENVTQAEVEKMSIDEVIGFVNTFNSRYDINGQKTVVLTSAQMYAVERVLEYDLGI